MTKKTTKTTKTETTTKTKTAFPKGNGDKRGKDGRLYVYVDPKVKKWFQDKAYDNKTSCSEYVGKVLMEKFNRSTAKKKAA